MSEIPDDVDSDADALVRIVGCELVTDGGWVAAETVSAFGYTRWPNFDQVYRRGERIMADLDATGVAKTALSIPPIPFAAAIRTSGMVTIPSGRQLWAQHTNYVAGSAAPRGGRLYVHSVFVDVHSRTRLTDSINELSVAAHQQFAASLRAPGSAAGVEPRPRW